MKKIIIGSLIAGFLAMTMSGCGPKVVTIPHNQAPVITPDTEHAVVYVIRPWYSQGAGRNITVYEDGKTIGVVANATFFIYKTTPGQHFYHEERVDIQTELNVEAGKTYYLAAHFKDLGFFTGLAFTTIPESAAKQMIPKLKYALP